MVQVVTAKVPQPLKWHGGKSYLAKQIIALMPPHLHYVEPYAGGLAVLLAKNPKGYSEVVNDLDQQLTNFWRVLQGSNTFSAFQRIVQAVPFSEAEWQEAGRRDVMREASLVGRAVSFFVRCRQSLAGRMGTFAPLSRTRIRRGMNEQASAWLTAIDGLSAVHARLRRVAILCRPALEVITSQDGPNTLFYCDPPYLKATRASPNVYTIEMSKADHVALLNVLARIEGKFLLSGYHSLLYDEFAAQRGWACTEIEIDNKAAGGASKRTMVECLWSNFEQLG